MSLDEELGPGYVNECSDDDVRPLSSIGVPLCMLCYDDNDENRPNGMCCARDCCPIDLGLNDGDFADYIAASEDDESEDEEFLSAGVQDNSSSLGSAVF